MSLETGPFRRLPEVSRPPARRRRGPLPASVWKGWDDERLLDLRLRDLDVRITGTPLEGIIAELRRELLVRGLKLRPHFWLSSDWFCPDGVPGAAIPFYLAHPRLSELELSQMCEVEGGSREACLRIMRHELGHVLANGYQLRRRGRLRRLFGSPSLPYPSSYIPRLLSRRYVRHLDDGYGQSHPDEDLAETIAVWLTPGLDWRRRYAGWPALDKLKYIDTVMRELAGQQPRVTSRERLDPLARLSQTLREHYAERRRHYRVADYESLGRDLRRLFSAAPEHRGNPSAAELIERLGKRVGRQVRSWTNEPQQVVDRVLAELADRCRDLDLRLAGSAEEIQDELVILLTVKTLQYRHDGRHRLAL